MEHRENDGSAAKQVAPETAALEPADEGRPWTEEEIKPGDNQDRATSGSFSSGPRGRAVEADPLNLSPDDPEWSDIPTGRTAPPHEREQPIPNERTRRP